MNKALKNQTCSSGKFKRLNYYEGMLLTEQDFKAEQNYFREKMKLHNRLHGYGVVWGLEITQKQVREGEKCVDKFFIEPGFALDCAGNEIIICHPYRLPIDEKVKELAQRCPPLEEEVCLSISIKYCEVKTEPQPQYSSACEDDELQVKMSRVCEGFSVELLPKQETKDCCKQHPDQDCNCNNTYRQDCVGVKDCCEDQYGIVLGCICIKPKDKEQDCEDVKVPEGEDLTHGPIVDSTGETRNPERDAGKELISYGSLQVYIDPCCKPPRVCRPCASPQEKWEHHKQQLIQEICKKTDAIDLTCLIGMSVKEVALCIEQLGLIVSEMHQLSKFPNHLLPILNIASSCAYPRSEIVLVTDDEKSCVLFAYLFPLLGGQDSSSAKTKGGNQK